MPKRIDFVRGKTISQVLFAAGPREPKSQVFLLFSDGTYLELYANDKIRCCSALDEGGIEEIKRKSAHNKLFTMERQTLES